MSADVSTPPPAGTGATGPAGLSGVAPETGVSKPDPILVAHEMRRMFGGLRAVDADHIEVQRGTVTSLIGPNGAGKSTFFNLVTGFDKPTTGTWTFDGRPLAGLSAYRIARLGMVRTFQLTKTLMRLTTLENLMLGATDQRGERFLPAIFRPSWLAQEKEVEQRADELLDRFQLTHMRDEFAGTMSGGQRKLLEMARALMVRPNLLMVDEPMAGVNPALRQRLLEHLSELRADGMTIMLVEHDMDVVMEISDWIVCFAEGRVIAEGRPRDIRSNTAVIDAYLGAHRGLPAEGASADTATAEHAATPAEADQSATESTTGQAAPDPPERSAAPPPPARPEDTE